VSQRSNHFSRQIGSSNLSVYFKNSFGLFQKSSAKRMFVACSELIKTFITAFYPRLSSWTTFKNPYGGNIGHGVARWRHEILFRDFALEPCVVLRCCWHVYSFFKGGNLKFSGIMTEVKLQLLVLASPIATKTLLQRSWIKHRQRLIEIIHPPIAGITTTATTN